MNLPQPISAETVGAQASEIEVQAQAIRKSGLLARSTHLQRLFDFLLLCQRNGRVPKEVEVAVEGLGRAEGFDSGQDALVRVYAHKLRRKLEDYYRKEGRQNGARLTLPKGEYRLCLQVAATPEAALPPTAPPHWHRRVMLKPVRRQRVLLLVLVLSLLLNGGMLLRGLLTGGDDPVLALARSAPLWQPLFADERPVLIVVGDYYLFAEADEKENVRRLVRDFEINSPLDLANHLQLHPELVARQFDAGLGYLPTSVAHALNRLGPILNGSKKRAWGVVLSSELIPENLRSNHIVYIGQLSALGVLEDLVFARSGFRRGRSYDELVDLASGKHYDSDSGLPSSGKTSQKHLAYLSSFAGPSGNRILVVAGFRDAGLRELAEVLATPAGLESLAAQGGGQDFEALYQVSQLGLSSTAARPLLVRKLSVDSLKR